MSPQYNDNTMVLLTVQPTVYRSVMSHSKLILLNTVDRAVGRCPRIWSAKITEISPQPSLSRKKCICLLFDQL